MRNRIILVPLGGLGNRIRFLSSALARVSELDLRPIIVNIKTNMFPGELSQFMHLETFEYSSFSINSETLTLSMARIAQIMYGLRYGWHHARYGARSISRDDRLVCSFNLIDGYPISFIPLQVVSDKSLPVNYNAVHIRRSDNARAIANNPLSIYYDFIAESTLPVYVACDDGDVKSALVSSFQDKIVVRNVSTRRDCPGDLASAFSEMCVCINSRSFLGSKGSSFSAVIASHRDKYPTHS